MHARISQYGVCLGSRHLLNVWKKTLSIFRKRYKRETQLQWKTNRKSYVAYLLAPIPMMLKVIHLLQTFSSGIFLIVVQYDS